MSVVKFEVAVCLCTSLFIGVRSGQDGVCLILTTITLSTHEWLTSRGPYLNLVSRKCVFAEGMSQGIAQGGLLLPWLVCSLQSWDVLPSLLAAHLVCIGNLFQSSSPHFALCLSLHMILVCCILWSCVATVASMSYVGLVVLVHYIGMKHTNKSFTFGEMLVCAQLLAFTTLSLFIPSPTNLVASTEVMNIIPKIILSFILFSITFACLTNQYTYSKSSKTILTTCLLMGFVFSLLWMVSVAWEVLMFAIKTKTRWWILSYWVCTLVVGISLTKLIKAETIIVRKCFHFLAVVLFLPAQVYDPSFLQVALALAFGCFALVEGLRLAKIPFISAKIDGFLSGLIDHRDNGLIIFSHFSLLLGLALPIWISATLPSTTTHDQHSTLSFSGLMSLGIGDSFAAIIGTKYGHLHLVKGSNKSIEGSIGCFLSILIGWAVVKSFTLEFIKMMILPTLAATLFEATSSQNDNLFLPLYYYSILLLNNEIT